MEELDGYDWRWIVGCEGKYAVTRCGKIYSVPRTMWNGREVGGCFLTPLRGTAYYHVGLSFDGKPKKTRTIHQIVCEAFHGPRPTTAHEVAHGDGTKTNNHADNLRWATRKENVEDQRIHGVLRQGERNGKSRLTNEVVRHLRALHSAGAMPRDIMNDFPGIPRGTLSDVLYSKTWKHV